MHVYTSRIRGLEQTIGGYIHTSLNRTDFVIMNYRYFVGSSLIFFRIIKFYALSKLCLPKIMLSYTAFILCNSNKYAGNTCKGTVCLQSGCVTKKLFWLTQFTNCTFFMLLLPRTCILFTLLMQIKSGEKNHYRTLLPEFIYLFSQIFVLTVYLSLLPFFIA